MQVHARLDRSEMLWLQGALEKRCLQVAAGYDNGDDASWIIFLPFVSELIWSVNYWFVFTSFKWNCCHILFWVFLIYTCKVFMCVHFCFPPETSDDISVALCMEGHHWFTLETQRGGRGIEKETLTLISVGAANQSLMFQAKGCRECLWATEVRTGRNCYVTRTRIINLAHTLLNKVFRVWLGMVLYLHRRGSSSWDLALGVNSWTGFRDFTIFC